MAQSTVTISVRCGGDVITQTGSGSDAIAAGIDAANKEIDALTAHGGCPDVVSDIQAFKSKLTA